MRIEDYPAQEPLSANAQAYHAEVLRRAQDLAPTEEARYGSDPYQSIALFAPANPTGVVLAFIHGGGWTNGYKEWMSFMAPAYTARGIIFATLGYRLAPQHVYPAGLEDIAEALRWLTVHASKHGGDPGRLFIGGHSAGGHYAAWLAVRRNWQAQAGLPHDVVRGCLPISGVFTFGEGSGLTMRPRFLGPAGTDEDASPIANIDQNPPPFLLAHGDKDFPHLIAQAERMEAALRAKGGRVERLVLAGRDHFSASYAGGEPDGPYVPRALAWLEQMKAVPVPAHT
jgi:acetyl esterase/lipase